MTLYLSPLPSKKEIETYYKTNFTYTVVPATVKRLRQRAGHILEKLKSLNPDGISLLDIGSGYGYFLEEAKKTYMEGVGLEPSKKMYSHSKKAGLQVVNSALEDYHPKNKFDFITLIQIIEHVENPLQFLKKVETLMNKDAVLYIETPNLDSHLFHFEKESYTFLTPPDHLGIFSKKTFQELLSRTNLEILDVTTYSYPEHFMGVIKKILHSNPPLPSQTSFPSSTPPLSLSKKLKYILIDTMIASLLYKILNLNDKGTILELYIRKKK
ncbi:MAG: class I SAM-dependent methyltransferase [bacterium]|nr:class I SAM-dependent methyltransferase [bacterium]